MTGLAGPLWPLRWVVGASPQPSGNGIDREKRVDRSEMATTQKRQTMGASMNRERGSSREEKSAAEAGAQKKEEKEAGRPPRLPAAIDGAGGQPSWRFLPAEGKE